MSDTPIPSKRKWTKVWMGAVPTLLFLMWVYTALQFSRPPLSFLPKEIESTRNVYTVGEKSLISPISESSSWTWEPPQPIPTKKYLEEIARLGFVMRSKFHAYHEFLHPNGEFLLVQFVSEHSLLFEYNKIEIQYGRTESRPIYCLVKRLKAMYDKRRSPEEIQP